jgi:hypothetical protein
LRLLSASIKDLQSKIVIAGVDLAAEAAGLHKLPPVTKADDVLENYSTTNTLNLAYRMGLLTRAEWRRWELAYDIRKNLEHEDDEYEAQPEDCVYIFSTCINIVLAREPIELIRLSDVKAAIESPDRVSLTPDLLEDYGKAPEVRQTESRGCSSGSHEPANNPILCGRTRSRFCALSNRSPRTR